MMDMGSFGTGLISIDRKSTRLNSSHQIISYAVFCLKKKYALKQELGDLSKIKDPAHAEAVAAANIKARDFVAQIFKCFFVLDSGPRGFPSSPARRSSD